MNIGAAMIVRNEEAHLERCLASIAGLCDEIVVVDTGSTDRSIDIARSFGARVVERVWAADFAAARNVALEHVESPWALTIDADEAVTASDPCLVDATLRRPAVVVATVRQSPKLGWTECDEPRLTRTCHGLRYERAVHERIVGFSAEAVARAPIRIQHHGYESVDELVRKAARDLPIIERELTIRPDDNFLVAMRGKCLARLSDHRAACEAWQVGVDRDDRNCAALFIQHQLERGARCDELTDTMLTRFPDDVDLRWLAAQHALLDRDHERVIEVLDPLTRVDERDLTRGSRPRESVGAGLHERIGRSHLALRQPAEAASAFGRAAGLAGGTTRHAALQRLAANLVPA